nr:fused MFS/spermidine synthase [Rhodocyclaceae bacterium]
LRLQRAPEVSTRGWQVLAVFLAATLLIIGLNVPLLRGQLLNEPQEVTETAYADYSVIPTQTADGEPVRAFKVNSSTASLISDSSPPRYARYIDYLRQTLLKDLKLKNSDILVLGAGGFTLSHREPLNRYTFVDIDPKIQTIAEQQFLHEPIRGQFIVDDARHFVTNTAKHSGDRFDVVVVDVYSSHHNIPSHLVTREFWHDTRQVLRPNGVLLANLILDSKLQSDYASNVLATIESVYGRCAIEVLHKDRPLSNVEVLCQNGGASLSSKPAKHYTDEKNAADIDHARANAGR